MLLVHESEASPQGRPEVVIEASTCPRFMYPQLPEADVCIGATGVHESLPADDPKTGGYGDCEDSREENVFTMMRAVAQLRRRVDKMQGQGSVDSTEARPG